MYGAARLVRAERAGEVDETLAQPNVAQLLIDRCRRRVIEHDLRKAPVSTHARLRRRAGWPHTFSCSLSSRWPSRVSNMKSLQTSSPSLMPAVAAIRRTALPKSTCCAAAGTSTTISHPFSLPAFHVWRRYLQSSWPLATRREDFKSRSE